ncbi:hypothetical protein ACLOJK_008731, partial [Asimina triloba]
PLRVSALLQQTQHPTVINPDPNPEICRFCDLGDLESAMSLLSGSDLRKFQLDSSTYCSVLQLCADFKSLSDGRRVHAFLYSHGVDLDSALGSKLVFMYVKCGDLEQGRWVFDRIEKPNVFVWNLVMNEYMRIGQFGKSISLFKEMLESGMQPNSYTFPCVLKCLAALGNALGGERIHGYLVKLGYGSCNAVGNALVAFYSKCKIIHAAYKVFDEMDDKDVISWNSMISGYVSNDLAEKGVEVFRLMRFLGIVMDQATILSVMPACAEMGMLELGRAIHAHTLKSNFGEEVMLSSSLLDMYAKCGDLNGAAQIFERMSKKNVVSWTSMISGYARGGELDRAIKLFQEMSSEGIKPDVFAVTSMLHACTCCGSLEHGKSIHDYIMGNGLGSNPVVANALMDLYAKCGSTADARLIFDEMRIRDIVSWNTIIGGYSRNRLPNEALGLFTEMQLELKPNGVTMASILPACASLSALERGREIHGHILRNDFFSDVYVANALIDMYAKCGALVLARLLFDSITRKDLVSWTVMVAGYGMHGHGQQAIELFNQMLKLGIKPNEVSFVAILSACSHSGLVDEGWTFFHIISNCGIEPNLEHYVCMVDLLSRAGHLSKAYGFIKSMPIKPDSSVWAALLSGCWTHRDVKLAEKVAEHVFELEPENTSHYILLSNIYAEADKWDAAKKVRERIGSSKRLQERIGSSKRLQENPGCSWIEIKGKVHVFAAGDRSHPHAKRIKSLLEGVRTRMKEEGYESKQRYALADAEDVGKEAAVCGHSEKLAIAFGILKSPPRKPIRLAKNRRMCGDCHEVAKFISKMVGREVILRDSNRKEGVLVEDAGEESVGMYSLIEFLKILVTHESALLFL